MAVKHEWPFKVPMGEIRILGDAPKLEFTPINLPPVMQEVQSKCRLKKDEDPRVPIEILEIDGVKQKPNSTFLRLRASTVKKLEELVSKAKPQQEDLS